VFPKTLRRLQAFIGKLQIRELDGRSTALPTVSSLDKVSPKKDDAVAYLWRDLAAAVAARTGAECDATRKFRLAEALAEALADVESKMGDSEKRWPKGTGSLWLPRSVSRNLLVPVTK